MDKQRLLALMDASKELDLLYVEDDLELRGVTARLFEHFFKDVTLCSNGQEGLDSFRDGTFDLVITDISMPVMNGVEMIENIRLENTVIPIIVFSAHGLPEVLDKDINGFMRKPMQELKLFDLLEHTVSYINLKERLNGDQTVSKVVPKGIDDIQIAIDD